MPKASIYLAGPMRGIPRWNFDTFDKAKEMWIKNGWQVVSPADIDRALGIDPDGPLEQIDHDFSVRAIKLDIELLTTVTAIGLLPGWQLSSGATVELALAQFLGLLVYDGLTGEVLIHKVEKKPWSRIFYGE